MKRRFLRVTLLALVVAAGTGCSRAPDIEQCRREILALHRQVIQNHLDKNAAALAEPTADDYLSVSHGEVRPMTAADVEAMLAPYLATTTFSHYQDLAEPIIGVSDDGSIAWSIVQVRVAGTSAAGDDHDFDTRWAWLTLYRRDDDRWRRIADVSTNRAFEEGL